MSKKKAKKRMTRRETPKPRTRLKRSERIEKMVREMNEQLVSRSNETYERLFTEIAAKAGVDFQEIQAEADRRAAAKRRRVNQYQKRLEKLVQKEVASNRRKREREMRRIMAATRKACERLCGNPILKMETPLEGSTYVNYDVTDPGMIHTQAYASAHGAFDIDYSRPQHNRFHLRASVDNNDRQHLHLHAAVTMGMEFEIAPPEGDFFVVEQAWAPLMGDGMEFWYAGDMKCIDKLTFQSWGTWNGLRVSAEVTQAGWPGGIQWEYQSPGIRSYQQGETRNGDLGASPVRIHDPFAQIQPVFFYFRGSDGGGGPIHARIEVTCYVSSYYKHEEHSLSFEEPGQLWLYCVCLEGRRLDM